MARAAPPYQMNWPSGFVRLSNGNTLISIAQAPGSIREVRPDKTTARASEPGAEHPCTLVAIEE